MKLTTATVASTTLDPGVTDKIFFDSDVPGFGLRVRSSGLRNYVFQYKVGGATRRIAIGTASAITVAQARKTASELHARVRLGFDPSSEKRERVSRAADTFGALAEKFLGQYQAREATISEVTRHLRKYAAPLHSRPVTAITLRDIAELLSWLDRESGTVTRNRVRSSLAMLFAWGMREGLATANPVIGTTRSTETSRDRVLTDNELRRVWNAAGDSAFGKVVKMLILTGQRRNEIAKLEWREVDLERRTLTLAAERTKNKRAHVVPLGPTALALLAALPRTGESVFPYFNSWGYCKDLLDQKAGLFDWILHDLRRTTVTGMANIGIQPHVIEAVVNHVSGAKGGVAGVYNRASYAVEKVEALARWDAHLHELVTKQ